MEFPPQRPVMMQVTTATTITNPTTITVQALVGSVQLDGAGSITIPEGNAISITCDGGNTLGVFTITPTGTAQIVYFF
jgi:hypothetical protein